MVSLRRIRRLLEDGIADINPKSVGGIYYANLRTSDDVGEAANRALEEAGKNGHVIVPSADYTKAEGLALETPIESKYEGQTLDFDGSEVELADSVDDNMIKVSHDGTKVKNVHLIGNQSNNTFTAGLVNTTPVLDITLDDVEGEDMPAVIELDEADDSDIRNSGAEEEALSVTDAIVLKNCTDTTALNCRALSFENDGLRLENCRDMVLRAIGIIPSAEVDANHGIHIIGCKNSIIGGTIAAEDNCDIGVRDTAYDVGGANETFSTSNHIDVAVSGVSSIGFHISDAEKERIRGSISGDHPNGRTTQAFLVDSPNGIVNPQHDINLTGDTLTRITDTNETGQNVGMRISGHFSKINQTSTVGAGGNSTWRVSFGQAIPNPAVETVSGTSVEFESQGNKTTTDPSGQVTVDWSDEYAFGDKPIISVTLEQAGQWYVDSFTTDGSGNYTGATVQVTDSGGTAVGNGVETSLKVLGT